MKQQLLLMPSSRFWIQEQCNIFFQLFYSVSASSAFVRTKAKTRTALKLCRACFACWDAIPIPVNITSRDSRALLRSAERAFCRNAKPASARCRTTGLGCAQQALTRQGALYIQRHCLQESFSVPEWYHEALLAEAIASIWIVNSAHSCYTGLIKNFSGGSCRDRKASSNRR